MLAAMPLLADSWESLIAFVVIIVLSALSNWIKQRKGQPVEPPEEEPPGTPWRPAPSHPETEKTPPAPFDLERELRRMFGEEPPPPQPPPPEIVPAEPAAAPHPPPVLAGFPPQTAAPSVAMPGEAVSPELAKLAEARAAMERAASLDEAALARLEAAKALTEQARAEAPQLHRMFRRAPEVTAVLEALRTPRTARQAILAAVILGPPKALDEAPAAPYHV